MATIFTQVVRTAAFRTLAAGSLLMVAGSALPIPGLSAVERSAARAATPVTTPVGAIKDGRLGFVVTYFYYAMYQGEDACPSGMQHVPTTREYLEKVSAAERERLLRPENQRELYRRVDERGPKGENLCEAPWAVKDATQLTLSGDRNDGLNLDGWSGAGAPPARVCAQKQYIGEDGRGGVDNQLGRVVACLKGYREKGTMVPYFTQVMRDGMWSMLIDISDVQDRRNDPDVTVEIYSGADKMVKDASGNILAGASLAPVPDRRLHHVFKGRIVDGVLETTPADEAVIPNPMTKRETITMIQPRFRLTLLPDGGAKGYFAGYRTVESLLPKVGMDAEAEQYIGYTCEGMYHTLKRYADGNRDPKTGTCDQISTAFRVEAVPAFIVHPERNAARSFADATSR